MLADWPRPRKEPNEKKVIRGVPSAESVAILSVSGGRKIRSGLELTACFAPSRYLAPSPSKLRRCKILDGAVRYAPTHPHGPR